MCIEVQLRHQLWTCSEIFFAKVLAVCDSDVLQKSVKNSMKKIPVRHLACQSWQHFPTREAAACQLQ